MAFLIILLAIATLCVLSETCKSALQSLANLSCSKSSLDTASVAASTLRTDALSIHRLIHVSTTRLSVALGKPPPSYDLALVQLKDLTTQVGQLASCVSSFPSGMLQKEAIWSAERTIHALEIFAQTFETACRQDKHNKEYLVKMGAVHEAVEAAQDMSINENAALAKAFKRNVDSLNDSLAEVKEMMANDNASTMGFSDGWDELGEEFQKSLTVEERKRVNKVP
jgi:hypothetical protein